MTTSPRIRPLRIGLGVLIPVAGYMAFSAYRERPQPDRIQLPPGFQLNTFGTAPNARGMALGSGGTVFVGSMAAGVVTALVDADGNGVAEHRYTIDEGLASPSGLAFRDGALYVGAINRILRYDAIESHLTNPPDPVLVTDDLPTETHHGWKYLGFGPDGYLYVPVGAPCNVCLQNDERFASILRMRPDGTGREVFAHGVRNSVGFDWDPRTGDLWFTDNGRDQLGDDVPDDELNHAPVSGMHFGFPFCHAGTVRDPRFDSRACGEFTPPAQPMGAHVAAVGMTFYTGTMFPAEYRNNIFIAQHGSWNRSAKVGYRVMRVVVDGGRATRYEPFATGWLQGQSNWGRPADVLVALDGALLISDDQGGVVWRVSFGG